MMSSKDYIIDAIKEFCYDEGYDFLQDYSGRCMYGSRCVGYCYHKTISSDRFTEIVHAGSG